MKKSAYLEVCQKACSTLPRDEIEKMVKHFIENCKKFSILLNENILERCVPKDTCSMKNQVQEKELMAHVDSIMCWTNDEVSSPNIYLTNAVIELKDYEISKIYVYRLSEEAAATETMQHDSEELSVATHIILPAVEYQGLWESLYYDTNIKENLWNFVETAMIFSDRKVDPNIISWNKVVLLHGPPGTGKTSLCKALAQKVAIRLSEKYAFVELVEINSHSLFSKWFSESGKLVMKLFDEVKRLLDNPEALVCVLIDEIESLAHARKSCANGTEPSDAIRVVNALLTQLDQIKSYPNVLILTTSNVTEAIDLAFVDRADIKQYIGHPQYRAINQIYRSCLAELIRTELVISIPIDNIDKVHDIYVDIVTPEMFILYDQLCERSVGISGRSLRKIPFLAHAMYIKKSQCSVYEFIKAMEKAIEKQIKDNCLSK